MKWVLQRCHEGPSEDRGDGVLQPLMDVGGHQLDPAEASRRQ